MKVKLNHILSDLDGNSLRDERGELTVGKVAIQALIGQHRNDENMSADKKVALYELMCKVKSEPDNDFTVEEIAALKERIGLLFTPIVVGQCFKVLDQKI